MLKKIPFGLSLNMPTGKFTPLIILLAFLLIIPLAACSAPAITAATATEATASETEVTIPLVLYAADLEIDPVVVSPGEGIVITANVTNDSKTNKDYNAQLVINNIVEGEQVVTIPAGETRTLKFVGTKLIPGAYVVNLDNLSAQFLVLGPSEPIQTASELGDEPSPSAPSSSCCGVGPSSGDTGSGSSGGCGCSSVGGGCGCGG